MNNLHKSYKLVIKSIIIALITLSPLQLKSQSIIYKDSQIESAVSKISADSMRVYIDDLLRFKTRHNLSKRNDNYTGIGAAAKYLEERVESFRKGYEKFVSLERVDYRAGGEGSRLGREITLSNIVVTIKGSDPDNKVIALLAHYDSRVDDNSDSTSFAPGANDNGSGVAALLEISRILSAERLPATVKVIFLSGEEHGLLGAAHMAKLAKSENWNLIAVLNNDMIGNSHSSETDIRDNTVLRIFSENIPFTESDRESKARVFNSSENDSPSRQLARYIKETGERYVDNLFIKLIYRNDRFGRGGDHTPFSRQGFTAVRISEYYENYNRTHQKVGIYNGVKLGDMPDGVDFEYLRKNCAVNLSTVINLSKAPNPPTSVHTDVSSLGNVTTIKWKAPVSGAKPAGYFLLIRETDSSVWQRKIFVKGESATIPISKDNFFFAVQSVNDSYNESLAQFSTGGS
ncbi:MAG: M20/M25/M40 family metallo-hydrolase [Bacteroidales bacterium]|nr:M20/M25/M40 family metallo-hydrolase [Bacteroidales bacterium]